MIRAQIYLTETERKELSLLAHTEKKSQSALIREAIDQFITRNTTKNQSKLAAICAAEGLWKDRKDLPNFENLRKEFDERTK